jgi:SAM-dependent methyltransferase
VNFDKQYWDENYSEPQTMDGIGNAAGHLKYLTSVFSLELIDINSVVDLGAGFGFFLQKVVKHYMPYKVAAIEPSAFAFSKLQKKKIKYAESMQVRLEQMNLEEWCQRGTSKRESYDLGICMSVFQYLSKESLELVIPIMARRVKYLYLTFPTDAELKRQREEIAFYDQYALARPRDFYYKLLSPYFTVVSSRLMESKYYFDKETTNFTDLFYRF